jgi:uncharacterized membrane protein
VLREGAPRGASEATHGVRRIGWLAVVLGAVLAAADLSPLLASPSSPWRSAARLALAPTCHQRPDRCFRLGQEPMPACARCVGLHASGLLGGLLLTLGGVRTPSAWCPRGAVLVAGALLAADVALGTVVHTWDHPGLRFALGLLAGSSLLLALRSEGGTLAAR